MNLRGGGCYYNNLYVYELEKAEMCYFRKIIKLAGASLWDLEDSAL